MITARTGENMRVTTNFAQQGLLDGEKKKKKGKNTPELHTVNA
jgi:hypothetical protein